MDSLGIVPRHTRWACKVEVEVEVASMGCHCGLYRYIPGWMYI